MRGFVKAVCVAVLIWMAVPSQLRANTFDLVFTPGVTINAASTGSSFGPPFNYGFTPVGNFASVMGNGVTISSISVSADGHINGTSNVSGGPIVSFDWEIFVGPSLFGFAPGQITGSSTFPESIVSSAPTQLRFAEAGTTTAGATLTFPGSYDFTTNGPLNTGSFAQFLKGAVTSPTNFSQGLDVQVMLWSEAPGTNVDFSNIRVEIKGATPAATPEPSTLALLSSGVFGLLGYARKRRMLS